MTAYEVLKSELSFRYADLVQYLYPLKPMEVHLTERMDSALRQIAKGGDDTWLIRMAVADYMRLVWPRIFVDQGEALTSVTKSGRYREDARHARLFAEVLGIAPALSRDIKTSVRRQVGMCPIMIWWLNGVARLSGVNRDQLLAILLELKIDC